MDREDYETSESSISVYSASSDTPGGEPSVALMFKFHPAASDSIHDHLTVHAVRDYIIEYKPLSKSSAKVIVPQSASQGMIYKLNGSKINGNYKLTVEMYRIRPEQREAKIQSDRWQGSSTNEENCTLYVGSKLPEYTNEQHLRDHFKAFASSITKIELIRDKYTKKFKGFAFITFTSNEVAHAALKDHNRSNLLGMPIQVTFDLRKKGIEKVVGGIPIATLDTHAKTPIHDESTFRYPVSNEPSPDSISGAIGNLSLNDQASRPRCSIIIENLAPEFNESTIQSIVKVPMLSCKRVANPLGAVLIKFHKESDASFVVRDLNNKVVLGNLIHARMAPPVAPMLIDPPSNIVSSNTLGGSLLPTPPIMTGQPEYLRSQSNVSSQSYPHASLGTECPPQFQRGISITRNESEMSAQGSSCSVKVSHIARGVTKEQLYQHFRVAGEIVKQPVLFDTKGPFKYAYINYQDQLAAQRAVSIHDKSSLGGESITVKLSASKSFSSNDEDMSEENCERVLKLNPDQWNRLMHVNPTTGFNLFNEIMNPFRLNRDVKYNPDYQNNCIVFSGKRETVEDAQGYLSKHLNKEISVER